MKILELGAGTGAWYWLYQPLGFYVGSNGIGTEAELKTLCTEAHKYGMKVIVDVVANHLAGDHSSIQNDLKGSEYWHYYGSQIDYKNRYAVLLCLRKLSIQMQCNQYPNSEQDLIKVCTVRIVHCGK